MAVPENRCRAYPYRNTGRLAAHLSRRAPLVQRLCICFRFALLDLDEPWKVKYRSGAYLLSPRTPYECMGDVPNVCFPCAALHDEETGRIAIYYGCADTVTGLAFGYVPEIIEFTKRTSII